MAFLVLIRHGRYLLSLNTSIKGNASGGANNTVIIKKFKNFKFLIANSPKIKIKLNGPGISIYCWRRDLIITKYIPTVIVACDIIKINNIVGIGEITVKKKIISR